MRARNIKPGFFTNDSIAELPTETRLLFIGLWMIADREGRLEYRPKKIKGLVFPFDNYDVEPMLEDLSKLGFVEIYQAKGSKYIAIPNFLKHQNPHIKESPSRIPPKPDHGTNLGTNEHQPRQVPAPTQNGASTNLGTNEHQPRHERARLNPESGILNPESGILNEESRNPCPPSENKIQPKEEPDRLKAAADARRVAKKYRECVAPSSTPSNGVGEVQALLVDYLVPVSRLDAAIDNFAAYRKKIPRPPFAPHAKTFFAVAGPWEDFVDGVPEIIAEQQPVAKSKKDVEHEAFLKGLEKL